MTKREREVIKEVMEILERLPQGCVGEHGPTLAEMEEYWDTFGRPCEDDECYDICQQAWRRLEALL